MKGPLRVALVDDEDPPRLQLAQKLARFARETDVEFEIDSFSSGTELLSGFRADLDLLFLDVQMPDLDGFETAHRVRALDSRVIIIFATQLASHAIRGYEVDAQTYLVKPVEYFSLAQELRRALVKIQQSASESMLLSTTSGTARVELDSILYVASDKHRITVHALDRRHVVSATMKSFESELSTHGFYRANNSFLVNLDHVVGVQDSMCLLRNGDQLPVSRPRRKGFMEALARHMNRTSL